MRALVLQENLKTALNNIQKAIPSKPQLPILSSVLLTADETSLSLAATDLYFGILTKVGAEIKEPGSLAIPGDIFKRLVFSLPAGEMELESKETTLKLAQASSKTSLPSQAGDEYPQFPQVQGESFALSLEDLQSIEKAVSFAAASDITRPILTALLFSFSEAGLEIVSTDGYRLVTLFMEHIKAEKPLQLLIPVKALAEVVRIAGQTKSTDVQVTVSEELKQVLFSVENTQVFVRLLEGEFPPYQKIIPPDFKYEVTFDGEEFGAQVKRAFVFAKDASNIIRLEVTTDTLIIKSASPSSGEYIGKMPITRTGDEIIEIAFNAQYLMDFLNSVKPEEVTFCINESLKPALMRPSQLTHFRYIIMPFRVNS